MKNKIKELKGKELGLVGVIVLGFSVLLLLMLFVLAGIAGTESRKQQTKIYQLQADLVETKEELRETLELVDAYRQHNDAITSLLGQASDALETIAYGPYSREEVQALITKVADILREVNQNLDTDQVEEVSQSIVTNAISADVDPMLLLSVAITESNCRPTARGGSGEYGMLQVMPGTGRWIAGRLGYSKDWEPVNMLNIRQNVQFGAYYLRVVTREFGGNTYKGLLAYNRGSGGAKKWLASRSASSHRYVSRVQKNYSRYGGSGR